MPMASLETYLDRLPTRFAELKMMLADVVSLPHMKDSHRRSTMNGWTRMLQLAAPQRSRTVSKARLKMLGIGVRMVPAEGPNTENR